MMQVPDVGDWIAAVPQSRRELAAPADEVLSDADIETAPIPKMAPDRRRRPLPFGRHPNPVFQFVERLLPRSPDAE